MPKELSHVHAYRDQTGLMSVVNLLFIGQPSIDQELAGLAAELANELMDK